MQVSDKQLKRQNRRLELLKITVVLTIGGALLAL